MDAKDAALGTVVSNGRIAWIKARYSPNDAPWDGTDGYARSDRSIDREMVSGADMYDPCDLLNQRFCGRCGQAITQTRGVWFSANDDFECPDGEEIHRP